MDLKHTRTIKSDEKKRFITIHGGRAEIKFLPKKIECQFKYTTTEYGRNLTLLLTTNNRKKRQVTRRTYFLGECVRMHAYSIMMKSQQAQ